MKDCKYFLTYKGKELSFDNEAALDSFIRTNKLSNPDEISDILYSKGNLKEKFKDILVAHEIESKRSLEKVKEAGLIRSQNINLFEEDDTIYNDKVSVVEHIYDNYMDPFDEEAFKVHRLKQLKEEFPTKIEASLESMLEQEIDSWTYINKTGKVLDAIATIIFNRNNRLSKFKIDDKFNTAEFLQQYKPDDPNIPNTYDLEGISDEQVQEFVKQMIAIRDSINSNGTAFTQYVVESAHHPESGTFDLRGKLDLVIVRDNGTVDIYDFKTSTKFAGDLKPGMTSEWDRDKIKSTKYQLAFYKQMLNSLGIPSNKISLNIIPIHLVLDEGNPRISKSINVQNPIQVVIDSEITEHARKDIYTDLGKLVGETEVFDKTKEDISKMFPMMQLAEVTDIANIEYYEKQSIRKKNGKFFFMQYKDGKSTPVYGETVEELLPELRKQIESRKRHLTEQTLPAIRNELARRLEDYNAGALKEGQLFEHQDASLRLNLRKYFSIPGWRVLGSNEADVDKLLDLNTIVMVNDSFGTPQIDVIVLSNNDLTKRLNVGKGTSLLGKFYTDKELEVNNKIIHASMGNIEAIKGLVILNNLKSVLGDYKIGEVKVLNPAFKQAIATPMNKLRENFDLLTQKADIKNNIGADRNFLTPSEYAWTVLRFIDSPGHMRKYLEHSRVMNTMKSGIKNISKDVPFYDSQLSPKDNKLNRLEMLEKLYRYLGESEFFNQGIREDDESFDMHLFMTIANAIVDESDLYLDFYNEDVMTKFGFTYTELKNRSFVNGTYINNFDTVPIVKPIHQAYQKTLMNIRNRYVNYKRPTRKINEKLSSFINTATLNTSMFKMKNFYDQSEEGKKRFLLKDPSKDNSLSSFEKEYLEFWLETLNTERYGSWVKSGDSYKKVVDDTVRAEKIATKEWFEVPLIKGSTYSKLANGRFVKGMIENIYDSELNKRMEIDPKQAYATDKDVDNKAMMTMYNTFDLHQNKREEWLSQKEAEPHELFETHLEHILDMYVMSKITKEEYDKILPAINAATNVLKYTSFLSGQDRSAISDYVSDYLKTSVFNESLITEDMRGAFKAATLFKSVSSKFILGFNPLSAGKESLFGFYFHYSRALANSIFDKDKLGVNDLTKAYSIVWVDIAKQPFTQTLLENINWLYGMSMSERNEIPASMNYGKTDGIGRLGEKMFWANRAPDYLNRMTFLVGYMVKHGCYDAHTYNKEYDTVDYDWKKDKRFDALAKNDKSDKKKYNYQKALYDEMMRILIEEENVDIFDHKNGTTRKLTYEDQLPRAYTVKEIMSIKQESDSSFGYMDNETKMMFLKGSVGNLLYQFKTFISAKKSQYLLKRGTHDQGKMVHLTDMDGNLLYWTDKTNQDGTVDRVHTTEETDSPVVAWEGKMMEGILWSMADLFNVTDFAKMKEAWKDPIKMRNFMILFEELMIVYLIYMGLSAIFGDNYTETIANEDSFAVRNLATMIRKSQGDISPFDFGKEAISFEFPGWTWAGKVAEDLSEYITGDKTGWAVFANNAGAAQMFKKELRDANRAEMAERRRDQGK